MSNKENSQRPQAAPEVVKDVTSPSTKSAKANNNGGSLSQHATTYALAARPFTEISPDVHAYTDGERARNEIRAVPIAEISPDVNAFADGERRNNQNAFAPTPRPIAEIRPDINAYANGERARNEIRPVPIAEISPDVNAYADGERKGERTRPTPMARPIAEVAAEAQTVAFGAHKEIIEEEEVLLIGTRN